MAKASRRQFARWSIKMTYVAFYDAHGRPTAWIGENQNYPSIYLFDGKPVAWMAEDFVYSYSGRYLGWFQNGWIWDRQGQPVFFTSSASGGPVRPVRMVRPVRSARAARPVRSAREARPARPTRKQSWSPLSGVQFFLQ